MSSGWAPTFKRQMKAEELGGCASAFSPRPLPLRARRALRRPESARPPGGARGRRGRCGAARRRALGGCAVRTSKPGSGRERGAARGAAWGTPSLGEPGEREGEGGAGPRSSSRGRSPSDRVQQCGGRRGSPGADVRPRSRRRRGSPSPGAEAGGRQRRGRAPEPRRGDRASSPRRRRPRTGTATTRRRRGCRPARPSPVSDPRPCPARGADAGPASACPARPGPGAASIFLGGRGGPARRGPLAAPGACGHGLGAPGSAAVRPRFRRRAGGLGASPALVRSSGTCGPGQLSLPARSGPGLRAPGPRETLLSGGWQHHCDAPLGNMPN